MDVEEAQKNEARIFSELFTTDDVKEGTGAFIEKRKANFKGL
jgi:enoyl-CoA hydratase